MTPSFLSLMYRRHVYADPIKVTPEFVESRWQITQPAGANLAPAAFVTGALDPVHSRTNFLNWFQPLLIPVMVVIGKQIPPRSRAEMDVLAELPGIQMRILSGSLGLHEEYPDALAEVALSFL